MNVPRDVIASNRRGFTLIELLVVIAIIAILAAILFPVFAQARESARIITCVSNARQIMLGVLQYSEDYDERAPLYFNGCTIKPWDNFGPDPTGGGPGYYTCPYNGDYWPELVSPYIQSHKSYNGTAGASLQNSQVFFCPDAHQGPNLKAYIYDNLISYGMSDDWADWYCPGGCYDGTALSHSFTEVVSPATCIYLGEAYDIYADPGGSNWPGFAQLYGATDEYDWGCPAGRYADALVGDAFRHRGTKTNACNPPTSGQVDTVAFADGHVKAENAAFLADPENWSIRDGNGEFHNGVRCCACNITPGKCWWP